MQREECRYSAWATLVVALAIVLAGCATTYAPRRLDVPAELRDVQSKSVATSPCRYRS